MTRFKVGDILGSSYGNLEYEVVSVYIDGTYRVRDLNSGNYYTSDMKEYHRIDNQTKSTTKHTTVCTCPMDWTGITHDSECLDRGLSGG